MAVGQRIWVHGRIFSGDKLGPYLVLWMAVVYAQVLYPGGKAFIEPKVGPPFHGHLGRGEGEREEGGREERGREEGGREEGGGRGEGRDGREGRGGRERKKGRREDRAEGKMKRGSHVGVHI